MVARASRRQLRRLETLGKPGRRRDQRRRARRRPRDRAGLPPPHRRRRPEGRARPPRGHARPAARRRRRHPHRAHARHRRRADEAAAAGPAPAARPRRKEIGPRRRARRRPATSWSRPPRRGSRPTPRRVQPWDAKGYKMPGGTPSNPTLAPNLPAFPANLRKQLKGANYPAPHAHHGRRGRGRPGRLRHRARDRGPLLRRPGRPARSRRT